jgi:hypothetical protein
MTKPMQLMIAELAFSNSDFAFQGDHLFQGNFYGINIYDIANPAKPALLTSLVCPGGQGDVSVYKTCCSCRWKCPTGAWIVVRRAFRRNRRSPSSPHPLQEKRRSTRCR